MKDSRSAQVQLTQLVMQVTQQRSIQSFLERKFLNNQPTVYDA